MVPTFEVLDRGDELSDLVDGADDLLVSGDDAGGEANAVVVLTKVGRLKCCSLLHLSRLTPDGHTMSLSICCSVMKVSILNQI